jgi:hypothetical protein
MKRNLTHQATIRLTKEQHQKLQLAAWSLGVEVSTIIRAALDPLFNLTDNQIMITGSVAAFNNPVQALKTKGKKSSKMLAE